MRRKAQFMPEANHFFYTFFVFLSLTSIVTLHTIETNPIPSIDYFSLLCYNSGMGKARGFLCQTGTNKGYSDEESGKDDRANIADITDITSAVHSGHVHRS